jgi:transposase
VVFTPEPSELDEPRVPRRWVVERSFSWLNGFRALRILWSRLEKNFLAELSLGCAVIAFRAAGVLR